MKYQQKKKTGWLWKLSGTMGRHTTIGNTIYYTKLPARGKRLKHELFHVRQFKRVGFYKFLFLYLLALPIGYNPWRWKWEYVAFRKGSQYSDAKTRKILRSKLYGWLREKPFRKAR